jgi:hypothetical protein
VREPTDLFYSTLHNHNPNITDLNYWIWTLDAWTGTNEHTRPETNRTPEQLSTTFYHSHRAHPSITLIAKTAYCWHSLSTVTPLPL